jgi:alkylhydroperoxidase family enzyme
MPLDKPRIPPLPTNQWSPEVLDALATLGGGERPARKADEGGARVVNALATLAQHPALARAFLGFNRHLQFASSLLDRLRELAILRIGWRCRSEYEWAQHVLLAREAGLSDAEIARIGHDAIDASWPRLEATLLHAVDELHRDAVIGQATWDELAAQLEPKQLMDLIFTVGTYQLLAQVFNSLGVQLDPGLAAQAALDQGS